MNRGIRRGIGRLVRSFIIPDLPVTQQATADLTITTATQVITGMTITRVSLQRETVLVFASIGMHVSTAGSGFDNAHLYVDGVLQAPDVNGGRRTATSRGSYAGTWVISVAPGSHTYDMRVEKTINDGTSVVQAAGSSFTIMPLVTKQWQ